MHQPTLTALDRCDRCGAQAYTRWTKPRPVECGDPEPDAELLYCAHHTREHEAVLMLTDWKLDADDRAFLDESVTQQPRAGAGVTSEPDNVCPTCGRAWPVDRMPHRASGCKGWDEEPKLVPQTRTAQAVLRTP